MKLEQIISNKGYKIVWYGASGIQNFGSLSLFIENYSFDQEGNCRYLEGSSFLSIRSFCGDLIIL